MDFIFKYHGRGFIPGIWWERGVKSKFQAFGDLKRTISKLHSCPQSSVVKRTDQLVDGVQFTWSSTQISVPSVFSVVHFSVNVKPYSAHLYLVSSVPVTLLVSMLDEPDVLNS